MKRAFYSTLFFMSVALSAPLNGYRCPCTHVYPIKTVKKFYSALGKCRFPFAVAVLYDSCDQVAGDSDALLRMVNLVSNYSLYKDADVQFLTVNVTRNNLENLQYDFGINSVPAVLLFKEGSPVRDPSGQVVVLSGMIESSQLHAFIDEHIKGDLQERAQRKKEERQRRAEEAAYYWNTTPWWWGCGWSGCYPSWYGGCGYGCGGWGYGCGPRVGVSCGFCI